MGNPDEELARLAGRQSTVVGIRQLYDLGFSIQQVKTRVRRGQLHPRYDGVYTVVHRNVPVRGQLLAALLLAGEGSFLSGWTAAARRGVGTLDLRRIEVTVRSDHTPKRQPGVIFHRTTNPIDALEVSHLDRLPTSTVARILIELSRRARPAQLEWLLQEAVRADVFDPLALENLIERHSRTPGVGKLKRIADYYRPLGDMKSVLERMFDEEHARRPEIPPCERNVQLGIWEIDRHWPEHGVCLELDGRRFHTAVWDFEKDRYKDTRLQLMRQKPMRVGYWMWLKDKERQIANLLALLALGP